MEIKFRKSRNRQERVIKEVAIVLFISLVGLMMHLGVKAAEETVNATVTAQNVALSVSPGTVSYGTVGTGSSATTALNDGDSVDATQSIENTGNVAEDFDLKGQDTASWTLADSIGTAESYAHEYCDEGGGTDCDSTPTWTALSTTYASLTTNVGTSTTYPFDLRIQLPTSTSDTSEQSADVYVRATAY